MLECHHKKMRCDLNAPFYKDYKVKNTSKVSRDIRHYDRVHHALGLHFWVGEDFLFFFPTPGCFFFLNFLTDRRTVCLTRQHGLREGTWRRADVIMLIPCSAVPLSRLTSWLVPSGPLGLVTHCQTSPWSRGWVGGRWWLSVRRVARRAGSRTFRQTRCGLADRSSLGNVV